MRTKAIFCLILISVLFSASRKAGSPAEVLIDAESFSDAGGWVTDQQSEHILGSPYLMAHGAGKPVADAFTRLELPHAGVWHAYVRTYNWTSPWHDGEGPWKMPTSAELTDMLNNCDCTWCTDTNPRGLRAVGKNEYSSCSIFLPGAGFCSSSRGIYSEDVSGYYWSSSLNAGDSEYAWVLYFSIDSKEISNLGSRRYGYSVRPVRE